MNVLIVDDHKIVLEGLKQLLINCEKVNFVHTISNSRMVIPYLNSHEIDLLLTDLNMPDLTGIELIEKLQNSYPKLKIGVLSMYFNKKILLELKDLKVSLFLHKNSDMLELENAINALTNDKVYYQEDLNKIIGKQSELPLKNEFDILNLLSTREIEVYELVMQNYKSYEIAEKLFVSINTIKAHRKSILKKTNCKTIHELTILGIKLGIVNE